MDRFKNILFSPLGSHRAVVDHMAEKLGVA